MKVQLHYRIGPAAPSDQLIRNPLLDLLQAVRGSGSISAAAAALNLSYRHVWGELKRWEIELGDELLVWDKGRAARLSEFGEKLLFAERQAQARLQPQIEALRADLQRAFAMAFDPDAHVLTIYASHDPALASLRDRLGAERPAPLHLDLRFCGSVQALRALNEGRCMMAGFHTLESTQQASLAAQSFKPLLQPGQHKIIGFARRTQGLLLAAGNPLKLQRLSDLVATRARFVNRARETGTRLLLDECLAQAGIVAASLSGYEREEPSHAGVAHAIATGSADAGLGIEHAARSFGLDFVPLAREQYFLVCRKAALATPAVVALLLALQDSAWQQELADMPGYAADHCGEVLALHRLLPWWKLRPKRNARS